MEGIQYAFPMKYSYEAPEVSFYAPSDDTSCGSAYAKVADSEVFVSLSVFLSPSDVQAEIDSKEISSEFVSMVFNSLELAVPKQQDDDFLLFKIKIQLVQTGGSDDYAIALCLNQLAIHSSISLDTREKLFVNQLDINFSIFDSSDVNRKFNGCNLLQRQQLHGKFEIKDIWQEIW
eukprot:EST46927.1 Hypothetical protein SS50377_13084 [Spironucleus salmonicida]